MKVGELKKMLENVPDDLVIVSHQSDMERSGIMEKSFYGKIVKVKEEVRHTWDRFDGIDYDYTVFREDKDGSKEVFYM